MIVCVCHGASDRDVIRAIDHGASTIADLQRCGIGTDCGSCHNLLGQMLARARQADGGASAVTADAAAPAA